MQPVPRDCLAEGRVRLTAQDPVRSLQPGLIRRILFHECRKVLEVHLPRVSTADSFDADNLLEDFPVPRDRSADPTCDRLEVYEIVCDEHPKEVVEEADELELVPVLPVEAAESVGQILSGKFVPDPVARMQQFATAVLIKECHEHLRLGCLTREPELAFRSILSRCEIEPCLAHRAQRDERDADGHDGECQRAERDKRVPAIPRPKADEGHTVGDSPTTT